MLALFGLALLAACERDVTPPTLDAVLVVAGGSAIVTDTSSYLFTSSETGLTGQIAFDFTNVTRRTISLVNCLGGYRLWLEKQVGSDWTRAWSPVQLDCVSPPIVLRRGETRSDTLRIFGGHPGTNRFPLFMVDEVEGSYRLVIGAAYWNYNHDGPSFGQALPLQYTVSHPFEIRTD
jgi:hypothetical protein